MSDIGVKVSQIGWDVKTAGDANLYLSSSWPVLKIEKTDLSTGGATLGHGLTYPPLVLAWSTAMGLAVCSVNTKTFTLPSSGSMRYFIFRLPLNVAYQSPVINGPLEPQGGIDHDFGLKFAKDGKSLNSHDFRDFTLHSSVRSPLLHAVIYGPLATINGGAFSGVNGLKWTPDLPYRPLYFAFQSTDGNTYTPLSTIAQVPPKVSNDTDNGILVNAVGLAGYGSIVILKDPLDFPSHTGVTL